MKQSETPNTVRISSGFECEWGFGGRASFRGAHAPSRAAFGALAKGIFAVDRVGMQVSGSAPVPGAGRGVPPRRTLRVESPQCTGETGSPRRRDADANTRDACAPRIPAPERPVFLAGSLAACRRATSGVCRGAFVNATASWSAAVLCRLREPDRFSTHRKTSPQRKSSFGVSHSFRER